MRHFELYLLNVSNMLSIHKPRIRAQDAPFFIFSCPKSYPYKKRSCVCKRISNFNRYSSNNKLSTSSSGRKICIKKTKISIAFVYVVAFALTTVATQREIIAMLALFGQGQTLFYKG